MNVDIENISELIMNKEKISLFIELENIFFKLYKKHKKPVILDKQTLIDILLKAKFGNKSKNTIASWIDDYQKISILTSIDNPDCFNTMKKEENNSVIVCLRKNKDDKKMFKKTNQLMYPKKIHKKSKIIKFLHFSPYVHDIVRILCYMYNYYSYNYTRQGQKEEYMQKYNDLLNGNFMKLLIAINYINSSIEAYCKKIFKDVPNRLYPGYDIKIHDRCKFTKELVNILELYSDLPTIKQDTLSKPCKVVLDRILALVKDIEIIELSSQGIN